VTFELGAGENPGDGVIPVTNLPGDLDTQLAALHQGNRW
jgi:hypothetical protein